ncbi:Ribosomal RNA large subunit methyltransferase E [Termitomyces sp. J132]|nr:Ribosomal RNA large subunit methyltransferase E [Termitomyces sp. J132]
MLRSTLAVLARKSSSKTWLMRQSRDPYIKQRLSDPHSFRSRSAFKLLEIDKRWDFLEWPDVKNVVDLGAAPGGWSQVVAEKMGWYEPGHPEELSSCDPLNIDDLIDDDEFLYQPSIRGTTIAVDLLRMEPIRGVRYLQADFLSRETDMRIFDLLRKINRTDENDTRVEVVLSDMAANTTGNRTADIESSLDICHAVLRFAKRHLRSAEEMRREYGGVLLMKFFEDPLLHDFRENELELYFNDVKVIKPPSSRSESSEGYFLCQGFQGPEDYFAE